jgi:hypothetical protein
MARKRHRFVLSLVLLGAAAAALVAVTVVVHRRHLDPEERLYFLLRNDGVINRPEWPLTIHVRAVHGRTLLSPVLKWKTADGEIDTVVMAREGTLRVDQDSRRLHVQLRFGSACGASGDRETFDEREFTVDLPPGFARTP